MDLNQTRFISTESDEELMVYIDDRQKYLPETVEAGVVELQHRGHQFSDEELKVISEDMQARRNNAAAIDSKLSLFNNDYKNAIVEDPAAPLLYSRRVLYLFTFLFGAMFGSIMMAINLSKTEKKIGVFWVLLFGIAFTALQIWAVGLANQGSGGSVNIVGGIIAAYTIDLIFWKQFIGYATFYRARTFWVPLIIALILSGLIIFSIFYGGKQ
jgi:hypothetical protein